MHSAVAHCLAQRLGSIFGTHAHCHDHPAKIPFVCKPDSGLSHSFLFNSGHLVVVVVVTSVDRIIIEMLISSKLESLRSENRKMFFFPMIENALFSSEQNGKPLKFWDYVSLIRLFD
jgi:hypothetical protein